MKDQAIVLKAEVIEHGLGIERTQHRDAIGRQIEERAVIVSRRRAGLVDDRFDAGAREGNAGRRPGDAAADDQERFGATANLALAGSAGRPRRSGTASPTSA